VIRLAFGTVACLAIIVAAVSAAQTAWAAPFGVAAAVVGCLIVSLTDRGPIR
jgi:hypothetical protein